MKRHLMIFVGVALLALSLSGTAFGQWATPPDSSDAPTWYGNTADPHFYGYWNDTGTVFDYVCDYTANVSCPDCATLAYEITEEIFADTSGGTLDTTVINVSVDNCYDAANMKYFFLFMSGTGPAPSNRAILRNAEPEESQWFAYDRSAGGDADNWWIRVTARIYPQPESELIQLSIVDSLGIGVAVTECWVGTQCLYHEIPTLSEWGLIILSLLILTLVTVVMTRRKRAQVPA